MRISQVGAKPLIAGIYRFSLSQFTTNEDADKYIRRLYLRKNTPLSLQEILQNGLNIYHRLQSPPSLPVLNSLLKLFLHCKSPDKVSILWSDLQSSLITTNTTNISTKSNLIGSICSLWLRCCIESKTISIDQCIEMLQFITTQTQCPPLSIHGYLITKLIAKCQNHREHIHYLHHLINEHFFLGIDDLITRNTLITAYGRCKDTHSLQNALSIFNVMNHRDEVTLSAMMKCFIKMDQPQQALTLYTEHSGLHNEITAMLALKCCLFTNDFQSGQRIIDSLSPPPDIQHSQLIHTVIDYHCHFGDIHSAQKVYHSMNPSLRDTSTLNAILKGLIQHKKYHDAITLYDDCLNLHIHSNSYSNSDLNSIKITDLIHSLAIKACGALRDLEKARSIHNQLRRKIMDKKVNSKVVDALIGCYFECGDIQSAKDLFHEISNHSKSSNPSKDSNHSIFSVPVRTVNAMMKGTVFIGDCIEALRFYDTIPPSKRDEVSHLFAIKACIQSDDLQRGRIIHHGIGDVLPGIAIQNALIEFYSHFGSQYIPDAVAVFDQLEDGKKMYSAGSMMKMYLDYGQIDDALSIYDAFKSPTENVPHVLAIKACTMRLDYQRGKDIHHNHLSEYNLRCMEVLNALINFYGDCGKIDAAKKVFNGIKDGDKDIVTISSMMKALINNESTETLKEALCLYDAMGPESVDGNGMYSHIERDGIIHTLGIKACAELKDLEKGKEIHSMIQSMLNYEDTKGGNGGSNWSGSNQCHGGGVQLQNGLIKMYGDCGDLESAENVFLSIPEHRRDVVAYNSMMKAFIDNGSDDKALVLYEGMNEKLKDGDDVCHLLGITACLNMEDAKRGKQICDSLRGKILSMENSKNAILRNSGDARSGDGGIDRIKLKTTMIGCYGECQDIESAVEIYNSIPDSDKSIVTVSAMMEAYWCCDLHCSSIELFEHLPKLGLKPEIGCYVSALKACTNGTILHIGRQIHDEVKGTSMMRDIGILINLIKMYGKCGILEQCHLIFEDAICDEEIAGNIGIWNAMIHALGRNGETDAVMVVHERLVTLQQSKQELSGKHVATHDVKTFMHLLGACSHSGDAEKAKEIWNEIDDEEIKYNAKVMATLIDCLARKGALVEAEELVVSNRVMEPSAWVSLISGCKKHGDLKRAESVYKKMEELFEDEKEVMSPASVLMSSIYGFHGEDDKRDAIWEERMQRGWTKPEGISEIYVNGKVHRFVAGINGYRQRYGQRESQQIDWMLEGLLKELKEQYEYVMDERLVTRALKEGETKEGVLLRHSEKLALAFGLLHLTDDDESDIVINKNLRICPDCHDFIRLVSRLKDRKFIVSDANRVHVFESGKCTCNEFY